MKSFIVAATACLVFSVPVSAATDEECGTLWSQADVNKDGNLSGAEAIRYAAWMRVNGKSSSSDSMISKTVFMENCKTGVFTATTVDEGAPLEGANSFTESQAQDRALAAGYANLSALTKDDKGIWRGTAMKDGKSVRVAVDYKGNVVAN